MLIPHEHYMGHVPTDQIWQHLSSKLKAVAKTAHLDENKIESLAKAKHYSLMDIQDRLHALASGKLAGKAHLLNYPVDTPGREHSAVAYATKYGHDYVLNNIAKLKAAGIIGG